MRLICMVVLIGFAALLCSGVACEVVPIDSALALFICVTIMSLRSLQSFRVVGVSDSCFLTILSQLGLVLVR